MICVQFGILRSAADLVWLGMAHLSRYAGGSTSTWSRLSFTHIESHPTTHNQYSQPHSVSPAFLSPFNLHTLFITHNSVCYPIPSLVLLCLLYVSLFWHQSIELAIPTHSSFFLKSNGSFLLFIFSSQFRNCSRTSAGKVCLNQISIEIISCLAIQMSNSHFWRCWIMTVREERPSVWMKLGMSF